MTVHDRTCWTNIAVLKLRHHAFEAVYLAALAHRWVRAIRELPECVHSNPSISILSDVHVQRVVDLIWRRAATTRSERTLGV